MKLYNHNRAEVCTLEQAARIFGIDPSYIRHRAERDRYGYAFRYRGKRYPMTKFGTTWIIEKPEPVIHR